MFKSLRACAAIPLVGALLVGLSIVGLASPASADPPNPTTVGYTTLSNIQLNGVPGTQLVVAPGADVTISADWSDAGNPCGSCIIFLPVGWAGQPQAGCIENDAFTGDSGAGAVDLGAAPTTPGTYDIVGDYEEVFYCGQYWDAVASSGYQVVAQVVVPSGPPVITAGVSPPPVEATGPASGAQVNFAVPTATDFSGPVGVVCDHGSGSWFRVGQTIVTCTATGGPDDVPATAQTQLTVTVTPFVWPPAPAPNPPVMGTATAGNGATMVSFGPPVYPPSHSISNYTMTCVSSDGGATGSASGINTPMTVSGLTNGDTYTCTATATNIGGTSRPSSASNSFVPARVVSCTQTQTCSAMTSAPISSTNPAETVQVTGTPTAANGSVQVSVHTAVLNCPGVPPAIAAVTTLNDTGFPATSSLHATVTQLAVATGPGRICYSSTTPFLSVTHPTIPTAGTFLLLQCSAVGNQAPCQVSSSQTKSSIVVKFLVAGGDPLFKVVVPTGRLVWPSILPSGKVGAAYSAHLQSSGGKAPFHWKVASGKVPAGLTLNAPTGAISGKPTARGTFAFVARVTDSESTPQSADINVSITIS
jgi:hypothetical protein